MEPKGKEIAVLSEGHYEDSELWTSLLRALQNLGDAENAQLKNRPRHVQETVHPDRNEAQLPSVTFGRT